MANRKRTISIEPAFEAAISSGVMPCFERALTSAPASTSSRTFSRLVMPHIRGVASNEFLTFASAPAASSNFTASTLPTEAAYISGVAPRRSFSFTSPAAIRLFSCARSFARIAL